MDRDIRDLPLWKVIYWTVAVIIVLGVIFLVFGVLGPLVVEHQLDYIKVFAALSIVIGGVMVLIAIKGPVHLAKPILRKEASDLPREPDTIGYIILGGAFIVGGLIYGRTSQVELLVVSFGLAVVTIRVRAYFREKNAYPLFIEPAQLAVKSPEEWSGTEADEYLKWLLGVMDQRISLLLKYFREDPSGSPEEVLSRLGEKVEQALRHRAFATDGAEGRTFTDQGYAVAVDMGLLVANFLVDVCGHAVKWAVLRGPETDPSFNLPVLSGFGKLTFDPIGESIAEAYAVLDGRRERDAWRNIFVLWKERAGLS